LNFIEQPQRQRCARGVDTEVALQAPGHGNMGHLDGRETPALRDLACGGLDHTFFQHRQDKCVLHGTGAAQVFQRERVVLIGMHGGGGLRRGVHGVAPSCALFKTK
jgi:hypothetical protein